MIRIAITAEAFAALADTMPLGSVIVEPAVNEWGDREIWLEEEYLAACASCAGQARATAT